MPFTKLFYHTVWTTKNRIPVISPHIEDIVHKTIISKSTSLKCPILAINSASDHIHIAVCIPPSIAVADWVRQVKGVSAHEVNVSFPDLHEHFQWQQSYGVLTFGAKQIDVVIDYIARQKEHHAHNRLQESLEQTEE
jgi:putative transposase